MTHIFVYYGVIVFVLTIQLITWTIFIVITIKLLQESHKAVTTEKSALTKELKKDLLILITLFALLGMSKVLTAAFVLASGVIHDISASTSPQTVHYWACHRSSPRACLVSTAGSETEGGTSTVVPVALLPV